MELRWEKRYKEQEERLMKQFSEMQTKK
jgi:hypothetical protein